MDTFWGIHIFLYDTLHLRIYQIPDTYTYSVCLPCKIQELQKRY